MINLPEQNVTLNQLNAMFQYMAYNIATINSYGEGEVYEINTNTVENYPLLWCEVLPTGINEQYTTYNYRLYVMDLVHPDFSNRMEVQSDSLSTLHHILYSIRDTYNFLIEWNITATPFVDAFPDKVAGWFTEVKIQVPWGFGSCDVPIKRPFGYNFFIDYDNTPFLDSNNKNVLTY